MRHLLVRCARAAMLTKKDMALNPLATEWLFM